jgi:glycosyltransferase involved in cell wall biosynthesis
LHPPGIPRPALRQIEARCLGTRSGASHAWEQLRLPLAARDGLLLNLTGSAPWFASRQVCMLHDAAPFDCPQSYTWAFRTWYQRLFRRVAARAELVLTVSRFSQGRLAAVLGLPAQRIRVIPNGGDHLQDTVPEPGVLARLGLQPGRYLLTVGSQNPHKGHAGLAQAFEALPPEPGLRLVVVGGADPRVFAGILPPVSGGAVVRTGPLSDGELKALYQHALALIFPSRYEGFGLPPIEAMSAGCPVAVARAGALPEVCADAALYFEPDDAASLGAALRSLIDDAALREQLRVRGHARAGQFRWQSSAVTLAHAIEQALQVAEA